MMKHAWVVIAVVVCVACGKDKKKEDDKASTPTPGSAEPVAAKPAEDKPAEKPLPEAEMVEHDLAPFGEAFAGYVVTAPKTAKLEFDDPSRMIVLSDEDFISLSEAEYWEDGMKALASDKDNSNIKQVSETEVRWERNPPLGKAWNVDVLVKLGEQKWSCGSGSTGTFHSSAMADRIATICKSIRKKS